MAGFYVRPLFHFLLTYGATALEHSPGFTPASLWPGNLMQENGLITGLTSRVFCFSGITSFCCLMFSMLATTVFYMLPSFLLFQAGG